MSDSDLDPSVPELALRVVDPAEQAAAEARLDAAGRAELVRLDARLGALAKALPPEPPPAALFDRVLQRVRAAVPPAEGTLTVRADEGRWDAMGPGVTFKLVWQDRRAGRRGMLVRLEPGAVHPAHGHDQDEECLVLEGELRFGDLPLAAGDFHFSRKGHRHPDAISDTGCLLYISGGL
jgi:hypothetical protein